jgi:hypothetical protein
MYIMGLQSRLLGLENLTLIEQLADSPALPGYIVDSRRELSRGCL